MNLTDEAIEDAARKLHEIAPVHYYAQEFEDLSGNDMEEMREDVRQILEAGGKFLVAEALEREADVCDERADRAFKRAMMLDSDYEQGRGKGHTEDGNRLRAQVASYRAR